MAAMDQGPRQDRAGRRVRGLAAARRRRRLFRPVQNFRRPTNCATDPVLRPDLDGGRLKLLARAGNPLVDMGRFGVRL
jgi:hypothetical protein